ncbi:MAG: methylenetetrahydrofolate reductase [Hydrogenophilaceae bacterium]|jgi:methylenetetrahydrofolate reductase (NADPH)|nr:methylenetetrahydrofolate reductase [Hydrogenophilaceae bacterium]
MSAALMPALAHPQTLLADWSLEMTAKDADALADASDAIPAGAQVSLTFLPDEDFDQRIEAAVLIRRLGLEPMPHLSARRIASEADLDMYLDCLTACAGVDRVFVVAGDPPRPIGPYEDALALIRSGLLAKYGVRHVGIAGYPEGHSAIPAAKLAQAMRDKLAALADLGHEASICTQFGFDAEPMLEWVARLRDAGVSAPVRLGLAGPASVKTLLRFAARCGVGVSAKVMAKYGLSMTRLLNNAGPAPLIDALERTLDPAVHGDVRLHFYPFGGLAKTADWVRDFTASRVC